MKKSAASAAVSVVSEIVLAGVSQETVDDSLLDKDRDRQTDTFLPLVKTVCKVANNNNKRISISCRSSCSSSSQTRAQTHTSLLNEPSFSLSNKLAYLSIRQMSIWGNGERKREGENSHNK